MHKDRSHLFDIDRAKGLAILLVVFGHIVMHNQPLGNQWYKTLRDAVYDFHMPFFVYLSGIVMFYSGSAYTSSSQYFSYLSKRAYRFLLPFMLMGILISLGKAGASFLIHVDNNPAGIFESFKALVWNTSDSPATSLWYIFVMFVFCIIIPPLMWLTKGRIWPLFLLSIAIYTAPFPAYMYLDKISYFFIFFMIGGLTTLKLFEYRDFIKKYHIVFMLLFALSFLLIYFDILWIIRLAVIGTLSMPALHSLVMQKPFAQSDLLLFFGKYCYVIYLFNTIAIGVTKGIMLKFMSWDGPNFLIFAPILFLAGVLGPIILKVTVLRRLPVLDKITS